MRARFGGALLVLLCAAHGAGARQLVVTVRDSSARTPVAGAIVTATDRANGTRVYALTNQEGRATLTLPSMLAYFAPDDDVMLSDAFLRTHCFRTPAVDADPALAELEFWPVPRRHTPDVAGVAYVDTLSGELRRIVFKFVHIGAFVPRSAVHAGGNVTFRRHDSGEWVVADWIIRMPEIARETWFTMRDLSGYQEFGGSLLSADEARADSLMLVQQLAERDSVALSRGPADTGRFVASTDTSIVDIVGSVRIRRDRPFFVSARTVEARTRFSQRRAEMEGVFLDSAVSGASLCFPKVFIDERAVPLSLAELRQFRAVQGATREVYLPDAPVAKEAMFEGSLVFGGNKCGVIQLRLYLDYRALAQ